MTQGRLMLMPTCLAVMAAVGLLALFAEGAAAAENPVVVLDTNMGPITVELFADKAPKTVENFLKYAESGHFDGTVFHRVIPGFMIQGGGFDQNLKEKQTQPPIKNEASNGLSNARGTLAMARTNDPDSATAQFFINVADNARGLDPRPGSAGYAVFGKVIDGMEVADKIVSVPTEQKLLEMEVAPGTYRKVPADDVPSQPVVIKSAKVKSK